jgi:hypothetical protein
MAVNILSDNNRIIGALDHTLVIAHYINHTYLRVFLLSYPHGKFFVNDSFGCKYASGAVVVYV